MIQIANLDKSFGSKVILRNINLTIPKGKVIALIGSNGAGKSTLLSIMARLEKPSNGKIYLDNQKTNHIPLKEFAKKIAFLKQQNEYSLKLKVAELIEFGRFPHSQGNLNLADLAKIEEALHFMDIVDIRNAYINEISGGQRQRVFLAMTIAQDTDYILLDEPLNNLDMKHSRDVMKLISRLALELNKTIIIVIHDINFAVNFSDYLIGMKNGEVLYTGKTKEILSHEVLEDLFDIKFEILQQPSTLICNYYYK